MTRRHFLATAAAATLIAPALARAATADFAALGAEAYVYCLPYVEMARTRYATLYGAKLPVDKFLHRRALSTDKDRAITTPNNDTLYSSARLDLGQGPVLAATPDFGSRYWSLALMSMTTDNFAVLGTRTTGNAPGKFLIVGPDWQGDLPAGAQLVRSPTRWVWALARILVDGPADLPAVHRLQDAMTLTPVNRQVVTPPLPQPPAEGEAAPFFAHAASVLAEDPPPAADAPVLARIAAMGIVPGLPFPAVKLSPVQQAAIADGYAQARAKIRQAGIVDAGTKRNGWTIPPGNVGDFGTDYGLRAGVALSGLAALPPAEALYYSSRGAATPLTGASNWRLVFPAGGEPPVNAFWSLSMYEATPEGRFFFVPNPLNRFAIGDRTRGMMRNPDGSLEILIQQTAPAGREGNWLPAPPGPFMITLRAYLPKPAMLEGRWVPPAVTVAP